MAFTSVNKSTSSTTLASTEIRMGSRLQSAKTPTRSIYFSIARSIISKAGWKVVEKPENETKGYTCAVNILEGSGDDAGFLLLVQGAPKPYSFSASGATSSLVGAVSVTAFVHYVLNDVTMDIPPETVEFTVDEKECSILIQCPDWFRYNPLSAPELDEHEEILRQAKMPLDVLLKEVAQEERDRINEETAIAMAHELLIDRPRRKQQVTVHPNYDEDAPDVVVAPGKDADLPAMNRSERRVLAKKVAQAMPRSRR